MPSVQITVLCNTRFPSTAAHGIYLARLCESFAEQRVEVELVVPKRFKEVAEDPFKYYAIKTPFRLRKIWSFDFLIFGLVLRRLAFVLQYFNFYLFSIFYFLFRSRNRIIYTMDNFGCLLSFFGYRVIFETHVGIGSYRSHMFPLLKRANRIVAVNSIIKADFVRAGFEQEKILVAPNGVDLSVFAGNDSKRELRQNLKLPIDKKIIAYIGKYKTMGMDKGVGSLVQAFGTLHRNKADTHLLIVGLGEEEKSELNEVFVHAGVVTNAYTLAGHLPQIEVAKFMRASDVLVMNYPNTAYYRNYMSPMKMFEYMASGVPIVTSDLPSVREILNDDCALFVRPDDRNDLERGIMQLLNETSLGERLAKNAMEKVSDFTWEKRAKRILDFIGEKKCKV